MGTDTARLDYVVTGQAQLAALDAQLSKIQSLMFNLGRAKDVSLIGAMGFGKVDEQLGAIRSGIAGVNADLGKMTPTAAKAGDAVGSIGTAATAAAPKLNAAKAAAAGLGSAMPTSQIEQFTTAFKKGIATAGTFASKLVILMLAFAAFRAVQTIITGVIQGFKDLDTATRKILSAEAVGAESNRSYAETFLTVAYNAIKFRTAVKDVGDATWELKSAGLSTSEALAGTGTVLKLLTADVTDVGMATRLTAGIYRTYRDELLKTRTEAEAFTYIGDVLAYTLNKSQVNMEGLIAGFKHSLGVSAAAGIEFEVLAASIAILNDRMMFGSIAGTGMRAAMIQISQDLDKIAARYNLVVDRGKSMGSQLMPILAQLHDQVQTGNLSIQEMEFWLKATGARGGQAILTLIQQYPELIKMVNALKTEAAGSLDAMANIRMDSLTRNIDSAKVSLKSFGAMAAGPLMNNLNTLLSGFNDTSAALIRLGEIAGKHIPIRFTFSDDDMAKMKWWQRVLLDLGKQSLGLMLPGSGLFVGGLGDMFKMAADGLEKLGVAADVSKDKLKELYVAMSETKKTSFVEAMLGDVDMLSVKVAEGSVTLDDYNAAIDTVTDSMNDNRDRIVALYAALSDETVMRGKSKDEAAAMRDEYENVTKTYLAQRKELASLNKEMSKMGDMKGWALDTLFKTGDIGASDYLAALKKDTDAAIESANKMWAEKPGTAASFEALKTAGEKMNEYGSAAEKTKKAVSDLADAQDKFLAAGLESLSFGGDESISSIKDRIFYLEQFKRTLADPSDILEVDKALAEMYKTLGGKGVNVSWDQQKIFEDIIALGKQVPAPIDEMSNKLAGLNAGPVAIFNQNLTDIKDGVIPGIATKVSGDLTAGFGVARNAVGMMNSALDETIKKVNIVVAALRLQQGLSTANQSLVGGFGGSQSINQQLKVGD